MSLEDDYNAICRVAEKLRERAERAEALADQVAEALWPLAVEYDRKLRAERRSHAPQSDLKLDRAKTAYAAWEEAHRETRP